MLFEGALLALVVGRIAGGRFHRLARIPLRGAVLLFVALVLKAAAMAAPSRGEWQLGVALAPFLHLATYLVLIVALAVNWRLSDLRVVAVGVGLNFLVLAANLGYMPTDPRAVTPAQRAALEAGRLGLGVVADEHTRLNFLGDRFAPPKPYPRPAPFSAGDVFITIGACLLILRGMGAFGLRPPAAPPPARRDG